MMAEYNYTRDEVNIQKLSKEITTQITEFALQGVTYKGGKVYLTFAGDLSAPNVTLLETIVMAHSKHDLRNPDDFVFLVTKRDTLIREIVKYKTRESAIVFTAPVYKEEFIYSGEILTTKKIYHFYEDDTALLIETISYSSEIDGSYTLEIEEIG